MDVVGPGQSHAVGNESELPAHAEVNADDGSPIRDEGQLLSVPLQLDDDSAPKQARRASRPRLAAAVAANHVRAAQLDGADAPTKHLGLKRGPKMFDLW